MTSTSQVLTEVEVHSLKKRKLLSPQVAIVTATYLENVEALKHTYATYHNGSDTGEGLHDNSPKALGYDNTYIKPSNKTIHRPDVVEMECIDVEKHLDSCPCGHLHGEGEHEDITAVGMSNNPMRGPD